VGNPFRLQSTVTAGIVSAKGRDIDILDTQYGIESFIQTDAAVNQGNSGGALVNSEGALVGINTAIITYSGRYEGYSFAIPINLVRKVISDLKEFGTVHRGLLGIEARSVDDKIAQELELSEVRGVYVFRVSPESGSDVAGLKSGDIILSINEQKVGTLPELMEYVGRFRPGDTVELEVWSNDKTTKLRVELRNQLNTTDLVSIRKDKILTDLGFEVRDLILAEKKRTEQEGIKVVSIYRGSIIERTKMDPGFIITHINEERIDSSDDLVKALESITGRVVFQGFYEQYQGPFWYVFTK
jgi:S1-C subfamily serine protease